MSSSDLVRWSGLAAVAGGVLLVIAELSTLPTINEENLSEVAVTTSWAVQQLLFLLSSVLLLLGLVGLYARQSEAAGVLGLVGFLTAFLGTTLTAGVSFDQIVVLPILAAEAPEVVNGTPPLGILLPFLLFGVGWVLFGVATLRARVYPRRAAVLLVVGAGLAAVPLIFSTIIFALAVAWLGLGLFAGSGEAVQQPSRVS